MPDRKPLIEKPDPPELGLEEATEAAAELLADARNFLLGDLVLDPDEIGLGVHPTDGRTLLMARAGGFQIAIALEPHAVAGLRDHLCGAGGCARAGGKLVVAAGARDVAAAAAAAGEIPRA